MRRKKGRLHRDAKLRSVHTTQSTAGWFGQVAGTAFSIWSVDDGGSHMTGRLEGKVAIITGGASGIGLASAKIFAREGAAVVIADVKAAEGGQAQTEISASGGNAIFVETNVSDQASVKALVQRSLEFGGKIDVLFNNAGGSTPRDGRIVDVDDEEFWRALNLDLYGTWICTKLVAPHMMERRSGSIVNNASFFALMGWPGRDAYTSAKGGIVALTRSNAVAFASHNIRVNAIAPGNTRTARSANLTNSIPDLASLPSRHPLGVCDPDDIAYAALYLASEEARKVTGQVLAVDGGLTIS